MSTLIAYASKHGSSKKCAELLSKKLTGNIEIINLKEHGGVDLSDFDKIIIGGSIYAGRIQKEVNEFCLKNIDTLRKKKIGVFICCMNKNESEKQLNSAFPEEIIRLAATKECFGGEFNFKDMSFIERFITKMISKSLSKNDPSNIIDTTKDISMLSEENIDKFAMAMNS